MQTRWRKKKMRVCVFTSSCKCTSSSKCQVAPELMDIKLPNNRPGRECRCWLLLHLQRCPRLLVLLRKKIKRRKSSCKSVTVGRWFPTQRGEGQFVSAADNRKRSGSSNSSSSSVDLLACGVLPVICQMSIKLALCWCFCQWSEVLSIAYGSSSSPWLAVGRHCWRRKKPRRVGAIRWLLIVSSSRLTMRADGLAELFKGNSSQVNRWGGWEGYERWKKTIGL